MEMRQGVTLQPIVFSGLPTAPNAQPTMMALHNKCDKVGGKT